MRVVVDIPSYLDKYLEYIPTEDLPDVLVEALKCKIFSTEVNQPAAGLNLETLMSLLSSEGEIKTQRSTSNDFISESGQNNTDMQERLRFKVIDCIDNDDSDDDLDDFMDLIK